MRYIFLVFLVFWVVSCGATVPSSENISVKNAWDINVGWVKVSDSGVSVSQESGGVSVSSDGNVQMTNGSGTITAGGNGATMTQGDNTMTAWENGVSVGTGSKTQINSTNDMEKDPEVQKITKDIDTMFDDIEKEGE
jgi:hypothetical protein